MWMLSLFYTGAAVSAAGLPQLGIHFRERKDLLVRPNLCAPLELRGKSNNL